MRMMSNYSDEIFLNNVLPLSLRKKIIVTRNYTAFPIKNEVQITLESTRFAPQK